MAVYTCPGCGWSLLIKQHKPKGIDAMINIYYTPGRFHQVSRSAIAIHRTTGDHVRLQPVDSPKPTGEAKRRECRAAVSDYHQIRDQLKKAGAKYETGNGWWLEDVFLGRTQADAWPIFKKIYPTS
jgi:hypothetical protein